MSIPERFAGSKVYSVSGPELKCGACCAIDLYNLKLYPCPKCNLGRFCDKICLSRAHNCPYNFGCPKCGKGSFCCKLCTQEKS